MPKSPHKPPPGDPLTSSTPELKRKLTARRLLRNIGVVAVVFTLIGGPISGITTYANLGLSDTFLADWRSSFLKSVLVMLPASFVLMAIVDRYVKRLFLRLPQARQNIINGIIFGTLMQCVVTAVTTANNVGFSASGSFLSAWLMGFASALPLGILISIAMTTTIKPRLEAYMAR